ncbi:hypothetical protein FQR65_LT03079 [Abscondita terminalis]|nr:hypothetical protein FQR65_LT03079 [Abscondita terminalis]
MPLVHVSSDSCNLRLLSNRRPEKDPPSVTTYKAAVVEYAPKDEFLSKKQNFIENVQEYIRYIQQAAFQDVQILVFPEMGLTGNIANWRELEDISTEVPDPKLNISPCSYVESSKYAQFIIDLSCTIARQRMYTIVNLIESELDHHSKNKFYRNTNVVFDRNGVIIARYRKINLLNEPYFVPGTEQDVSTFTTDFGVTFGMFISGDILHKTPGKDILTNLAVTDIVYSSSWKSELPFWQANSVQHGYAKSNKVNLLASGRNDPSIGNGGSGIYLANGNIAETYVSGERKSKLIIQYVSKIEMRTKKYTSCQGSTTSTKQTFHLGIGQHLPDVTLFHTKQVDLTNYTFKSLNLHNKTISERICSGESTFCCDFYITVNKHSSVFQNYIYKIIAFYGVTRISSTETVGERICGLVACLDESNHSCGGRNMLSPTGVSFETISIKGIFNLRHSHYQPSTLKFDLTPATDYMYCTEEISRNEIEMNMITTKRHDSLLTFGILGRVFLNDNTYPGTINSGSTYLFSLSTTLLLTVNYYEFKHHDLEKLIIIKGGHRIKMPVETRWCSYRDSSQCFLSNLQYIKQIIADIGGKKKVEETVELSNPICNLINKCQNVTFSLAEAVDLWLNLQLSRNFQKYVDDRRKIALNDVAITAYFFHPRLKRDKETSELKMRLNNFVLLHLSGQELEEYDLYYIKSGAFKALYAKI